MLLAGQSLHPTTLLVEIMMPIAQSRILYVEDDVQLLEARSSLLRQEGYDVVTAETLTKALRLYRSFDFDQLLIGHSVTPKIRTVLAAISKRINPRAGVLVLVQGAEKPQLADGWTNQQDTASILEAVSFLLATTKPRRASTAAA